MKANHNKYLNEQKELLVVVNISKSKNESKSQQFIIRERSSKSCGKYQ